MSAQPRPRVLPIRTTKQAWNILRIHHSSIPDYDYEAACEGLTTQGIQQELEIDWLATGNKRVFPEFKELHIADEQLPFDPNLPLLLGWDFGQTPAMVPTQLSKRGQWWIYPPVVGPKDEAVGIYQFGETVSDYLTREFAIPAGVPLGELDLRHFGDPAGNQRPPKSGGTAGSKIEARTPIQVLKDGIQVVVGYDPITGEEKIDSLPGWGWHIEPGAIAIAERLEAVRARLTRLVDGGPALLVDPEAEVIIEAFMGGYHYKQRPDGSYDKDPLKNYFSHPMDALQYPATRFFGQAPRGTQERDTSPLDGFQSQAAGRRSRRFSA